MGNVKRRLDLINSTAMNRLQSISVESLWRAAALAFRYAGLCPDSELEASLSQKLCESLGLDPQSDWVGALTILLDDLRENASAANCNSTTNMDFAIENLQAAIHAAIQRKTVTLRFSAAVESRVAETMYNFAYGLSHDINNQLANISARAQNLETALVDQRHRQAAEVIVSQATRAHEMLAEMMLAVQMPKLRFVSGDIAASINACCSTLGDRASAAGLQFESDIDDRKLPARFDETAMTEVVLALFANSVQASQRGGFISLACHRVDEATGGQDGKSGDLLPAIRIAIIDSGIGFSEAMLKKAFDLYYCGREAGRSLGIGLCKVRRIVEGHGGRVWIETKERTGTAVEIRIPWLSERRS